MSEVKIYTVVSDELSPPVIGESFCTDMVRHSDYSALEQKLTDMAVQLANAESKCRGLAAENAALKSAFDKPQAYLSWHAIPPTWEDPLPCGEYLDVHDEAGHKNSDGTDCWPVYAKPEIKTPATDAFLAEVRAQGVEMAACALDDVNQFNYANMLDDLAQKLRQEAAK
ncbi:hypothetical protein LY264_19425 [Citrobacter portucalensis]|uniref:hypothetical protein n=1 Tax=Citrobacter portucalensis TaxID=1639133 RepID=UPI0014955D31|nr:hypothetical protein [Citrobacter portucalensis]UQQ19917.1 hypothetical protein LY264_19425 [Citrobacter portucalensis]